MPSKYFLVSSLFLILILSNSCSFFKSKTDHQNSNMSNPRQKFQNAQPIPERSPASMKSSEIIRKYYEAYAPSPTDLTLNELREILRRHRFSKISDLLAYLKKNKPEYMSRYTLMHKSFSLHEATPEQPRAIIFGDSGRFIISFNDNPAHKNYQMLEVVEFNDVAKKFEYREIEFNEFNQLQHPYKISRVNGPNNKCLSCHTNSRPIWNAYDTWPGAFGSLDDEGPGVSLKESGGIELLVGKNFKSVAKTQWEAFKNGPGKSGRYIHLNPLAPSRILKLSNQTSDSNYDTQILRPNSDLNVALSLLNFQRIGRILRNTVAGDDIRYVLLHAASDCRYERIEGQRLLAHLYYPIVGLNNRSHFLFELSELMKEYRTDLNEVRQNLIERSLTPPAFRTPADVISYLDSDPRILRDLVTNRASRLHLEDHLIVFLANIHFFVPAAQFETWPMQLYENVQDYETGGPPAYFFLNDAFIENVFAPFEKDLYERLKKATAARDTDEICAELRSKFPERYRKKVQELLTQNPKWND